MTPVKQPDRKVAMPAGSRFAVVSVTPSQAEQDAETLAAEPHDGGTARRRKAAPARPCRPGGAAAGLSQRL
ncbi:hypothetical protein, partial [Arthrobacter sp. Cr_A7]|uniref:hypothetical protein n=1 Tax=Arthrobacter sp. Cr_A7 TaxID=3031017 RepID=UPI0023DCE00E